MKWLDFLRSFAGEKSTPQGRSNTAEGEMRVSIGGEEFSIQPSSVSQARAAAVLPTEPSEDVSHLLGTIDIPAARDSLAEIREYLPYEKVEWVVSVEFPGSPRLDPRRVQALFDAEWQERFGSVTIYGKDADTGRWTFAVCGDGPKAVTQLKFAWNFVPHFEDDKPPTSNAQFEERIAQLSKALTEFGAPSVQPSVPPVEAAARARLLAKLKRDLNQSAVLVLKSPKGSLFDGKSIWDVMLCLGLQWGDMDCFHWTNSSGEGDDSYFSVETSTAPGYFLPEQIASDRVHVEDLVFVFSIPRCRAPLPVFDAMTRAVQYCQRRLHGEIRDQSGQPADLVTMRRQIAKIEEELVRAGLVPGTSDALRMF